MIDSFSDQYRWLSNFWVEPDGSTVEHEYQAFKASTSAADMLPIIKARTAGASKRAGRGVELHPLWEDIKVDVMRFFVTKKFAEHPDLARCLQETGDQVLIEGNHWHDNIWGVCTCGTCASKRASGELESTNYLGVILMEVRDAL